MGDDVAAILLTLAAENAELRQQLAAAQDLLVETAIDAGQMHAHAESMRAVLAEARAERDAWRDMALRPAAAASA